MKDSDKHLAPPRRDDARFADEVFESLGPVEPSAELSRRVAQIPLEHPKRTGVWPLPGIWQPLLAAAAAALLGVVTGTWTLEDERAAAGSTSSQSGARPTPSSELEAVEPKAAGSARKDDSSVAESERLQPTDDPLQDEDLDTLFSLALASEWDDEGIYGAQIVGSSASGKESL